MKVMNLKKLIVPFICTALTITTIINIDPITDKLTKIITNEPKIVTKPANKFVKDKNYLYVQNTNSFIPYSFQEILNIYYTAINSGWKQFTFYCPNEYKRCLSDVSKISSDEQILTHLNNYVHPFNSFTNVKTSMNDNGEVNLKIFYLYTDEQIKQIDEETDKVLKKLINDQMSDYDKIKTMHDYIINNTEYDISRNEDGTSKHLSYLAYGPLFEGYATCNGYTDLMSIYLTKMGFDNFEVATTPQEISYSATGHIWNAVYYNNEWLHIDLTWDDPVSNDNKDYLFHTYFLINNEQMKKADSGETVIEEHNFNKNYYLEFK